MPQEHPYDEAFQRKLLHLFVRKPKIREVVQPGYFSGPIHTEIARLVAEVYEKHPKDTLTKEAVLTRVKEFLGSKRRDIWPTYKSEIKKVFAQSTSDDDFVAEQATSFAKEKRYRQALVTMERLVTNGNYEGADRVFAKLATQFQTNGSNKPKVWSSLKFLKADFPSREALVKIGDTPLFTTQSINEIFAWRGTGKSMLSLALAGVLATGGRFLNWKVPRPVKVLYVDGELPNKQIQERMEWLLPRKARFRLITLDSQALNGIPSLDTEKGQAWLEAGLRDTEVLFLDSIATLAPFATNEEDKWLPFVAWLNRLRSRGLCIIRLQQAGKGGLQRGHSRADDGLDVQIKLATKDTDLDHLNCNLTYEKFRGQRRDVQPVAVEFKHNRWEYRPLNHDKMQMLQDYLKLNPNASTRQISKDIPSLGTNINVWKMKKKLKDQEKKAR